MSTEIEFPTLLYLCVPPGTAGSSPAPGGHAYKSAPAKSQAEADNLVKDGWAFSLEGAGSAIEAYDLAKSPEDTGQLPSTATPEERAAAAEALQTDAAERLNEANQAVVEDQEAADVANKALDAVLEEYVDATKAKADFDARYADLLARKNAAQAEALIKSKNLASSKLRAQGADRALDDAATKVITMGSLLTNAKKKALDAAAAKQKALAAAAKKDHPPPASPTPPAAPPAPPAPPAPDAPGEPTAPPLPDVLIPVAGQPGVRTKKAL